MPFYVCSMASWQGHADVVQLLLTRSERVDPSVKSNHAIRVASASGHVTVVKLLLTDPRVDPSDDSNYALRYVRRGRGEERR